jgi:photosystem II stability/assembly factor-like uncharacterized protein
MKFLAKFLLLFSILGQLNFAQWSPQTSGTFATLMDVYFLDNNTGWVSGANGTILKTTNGGLLWTAQNSGTTVNLFSIHFANTNSGWALGDSSKLIHTTNGGLTWQPQVIPAPVSTLTSMAFADALTGWLVGNYESYPGGSDCYIYKTTNGGAAWTSVSGFMDEEMQSLFFLDHNTGWICGTGVGKTTDGGLTWVGGGPEVSKHKDLLNVVDYYSIYFTDPTHGWFVGHEQNTGVIYRTTNGLNWTKVITDSSYEFFSIYFISPDTGWCIRSGGKLLFTTDGGLTWALQDTEGYLIADVCFPVDNTGWASGANGAILHTTNAGTPVELSSFTAEVSGNDAVLKWITASETNNSGFEIQKSTDGINFTRTGFIAGNGTSAETHSYTFTDKSLAAGDYSYRLKQIDYDGTFTYSPIVEVNVANISAFTLKQNYPNPFNPSTKITFTLPEQTKVRLSVFNLLGEEIALLLDEVRSAGEHSVNFEGDNFPAAIYFYKLQSLSYSSVRKMILLK